MSQTVPTQETLRVEEDVRQPLSPYLPNGTSSMHTTLTYATSLDSAISLQPGAPTILSGPRSKAMTHYLRMKHDAILVGFGTAAADDPGLCCRIAGATLEHQPRPIILDPSGRWNFSADSKVMRLARAGQGKAPWIITALNQPPADRVKLLQELGGRYLRLHVSDHRKGTSQAFNWEDILRCLSQQGIKSVMMEGGATVINDLLSPANAQWVNSVIVTIAPTWLGRGSLVIQPEKTRDERGGLGPAARLKDIRWITLGEDAIVCGRLEQR
ncbi:bacterial bifunctional deaminase-reductase [Eremomyces bilateralis CBS 781.70]|uniref:2,5-diamino-6-ribosylamino-4(3H)-pyrimidinone 5'-phosphate reductase n=1 Tax=Eremomyces bilateralis CBS 781.70 TaxID=1392243 RepID=A0A6G1G2S3_9PEZI|nr:bacterial bifunctional deaminase-reductase [Eremomyces bilateralis CBS 781.70]KAF1812220.1 bacterial bifunctional deaminase-reductase [Eremomyces bilateralis CBS 781.70]